MSGKAKKTPKQKISPGVHSYNWAQCYGSLLTRGKESALVQTGNSKLVKCSSKVSRILSVSAELRGKQIHDIVPWCDQALSCTKPMECMSPSSTCYTINLQHFKLYILYLYIYMLKQ